MRARFLLAWAAMAAVAAVAAAEPALRTIDLPTALRLAGAQNLDIQRAAHRVEEARANDAAAREQFFPWITVGGAYDHHEGRAAAVDGGLIDASKQSFEVAGALTAQISPGESYYQALAARQDRAAAEHAYAAQKLQTTLAAAMAYLELSRASAAVSIAEESQRVAQDYRQQLGRAVDTGLAFAGELRRVEVEVLRRRSEVRRRQESRRLAASRLAELLHLDAAVDLQPADTSPPGIVLVATNRPLDNLVATALHQRPELKAGEATAEAARDQRNQSLYGPLAPTLGAGVVGGGLGGGADGSWSHFGGTQDYLVSLGWRIGPGGLLDRPRQDAAAARWAAAKTRTAQIHDEIVAEVVNAQVRRQSGRDQAELSGAAVKAAEASLALSRDRRDFGVAAVLEFLQAEQALTASRDEWLTATAGVAVAEYALAAALGEIGGPSAGQ